MLQALAMAMPMRLEGDEVVDSAAKKEYSQSFAILSLHLILSNLSSAVVFSRDARNSNVTR